MSDDLTKHNENRAKAGLPPIQNLSKYLNKWLRKGSDNTYIFHLMVRDGYDWKLFRQQLANKVKCEKRQEQKVAADKAAVQVESRSSRTTAKSGWVYIVTNPTFPGWVKIGSAMDTEERLRSYQTYTPDQLYVLADRVFSKDRRSLEFAVHEALAPHRGNGEWFQVELGVAMKAIRETR